MKRLTMTRVLPGLIILLMVIPVVVFVGAALYPGMGIVETVAALGDDYTANRTNLLVVSLLSLVLLVALVVFVRKLLRKSPESSTVYAWAAAFAGY